MNAVQCNEMEHGVTIRALVRRCLAGVAPVYLQELCCSTLSVQHRGSFRSSKQAELLVTRSRTSIMQRRAFSVAGPAIWNWLGLALESTDLRLMHGALAATFISNFKTVLFSRGWVG